MNRLERVWHPEMFHGRSWRPSGFDGWYFKMVDPTERHVWAVIPGIWMDRDPSLQYCFIQFLDGTTGRTSMHRYPVQQFWASRDRFDIVVGTSRFSLTSMHLDIDDAGVRLAGDVQFTQPIGWPVHPWAPGAMGPLGLLPFLEGYHAITSIDPRISGSLALDGQEIDFTGGRGYMERDWGSAFPRAWVWMQSNHFDEDHVSLTVSIADIPLLGTVLRGFIVGFLYNGRLLQWTTWNGSRLAHFVRDDEHAEFTVVNGKQVLEVWAGGRHGMGQVYAPRAGSMAKMLVEELHAVVQVRLLERHASGDILLFEGRGRNCGLEISGDMPLVSSTTQPAPLSSNPAQHPQGL
ncbi:MAG: tocopherol cyclase family protein [Candidatus Cryosericum sp.]